jgi:CheY-like chemotaxis protein
LREFSELLEHTLPETIRVSLTVDSLQEGVDDIANIDTSRIHQVLLNLCVSARDAMPGGGKLIIVAENLKFDHLKTRQHPDVKPGPFAVITVADTGSGIAPELLEKIFEPFFTTKEPGKGTGLGLATVRGILKNHGGFVEVDSEVGKGTRFRICLPAVERHSSQTTFIRPAQMPAGHGELILVVDDEEAIQHIARATLENFAYRVVCASNGAEALAVYDQHRDEVKAVILDSMMPFMDGAEALRAFRQIAPSLKIIGVSGLSGEDKSAAVTGGVQAFLTKPYTAQELLLKLDAVLRNG